MIESSADLLSQANAVLAPYGCVATELGPDSVGVQGDARVYGPSIYVSFPTAMQPEEVQAISTELINKVRGLTRVLQNINI